MSISIAPFCKTDSKGVLRVIGQSLSVDSISESRFVRRVLLDPNFRAEGAPVAKTGDEVVGFCLSIARQVPLENAPSDAERGYVTLFAVAPEFERQGIGTKLLDLAESYLSAQGRKLCMIAPYAPGYFICGVDVKAYAGALAFLGKRGYAEVYRPIAMEAPLWDFNVPEWVREKRQTLAAQGVRVDPYCSELTLPLLEFVQKEFPGDWVRVCRETMGKIQLGDSPRRLLIAHENGRVLGFSHFENERFGPIGVAGDQRGRGLGQVLMYKTLSAQRRAGFRVAWFLWSDDKTAVRLYTAAGFREVRRFALMKKEL